MWASAGTQEERLKLNLIGMANDLLHFYKAADAGRKSKLTRISKMSKKTVGEVADQKLKSKGAETYALLLYCIHALERDHERLGADVVPLLETCECMSRIIDIFNASGANIPPADQRRCYEHRDGSPLFQAP